MPERPRVRDLIGWQIQLMEHRRALFERLVVAFAPELRNKRTEVDLWRTRLSGPKSCAS